MIEIRQTAVYSRWITGLKDDRARARIEVRIYRLSLGNTGDVKPVGEGVSELRIDYGPGSGLSDAAGQGFGDPALRRRQGQSDPRYRHRQGASPAIEGVTTMPLKTKKWDVTEFLDSEERIALFLEAAFEEDDPTLIAAALGEVARARGMTQMAKDTGISREALYRALSREGRPEFNTILKVMKAFGLRLSPVPIR